MSLSSEIVQGAVPTITKMNKEVPICPVISTDHTFDVQSRVLEQTEDGLKRVKEDALFIIMGANGHILGHRANSGTSGEGDGWIQDLRKLKARIDSYNESAPEEMKVAYPKHCCVDNCCNQKKQIHSVFAECEVSQDVKHLINRFLECCSKNSKYYKDFSIEIHGCLTEKQMNVRSRNGNIVQVDGRLRKGEDIWATMLEIVNRYRSWENLQPLNDSEPPISSEVIVVDDMSTIADIPSVIIHTNDRNQLQTSLPSQSLEHSESDFATVERFNTADEQNNVDSQQIEFPPTSTSSQPGTSRKKKKKGEKKEGPLFLKDFQSTFMAQKFHVLNCVKDPEINGQHCLEMDDEHFVLLRGTNRNESVHKRIKHFHPEKCGQDLHDNLMEGK